MAVPGHGEQRNAILGLTDDGRRVVYGQRSSYDDPTREEWPGEARMELRRWMKRQPGRRMWLLAQIGHVNRSTFSDWLYGEVRPPLGTMARIEEARARYEAV